MLMKVCDVCWKVIPLDGGNAVISAPDNDGNMVELNFCYECDEKVADLRTSIEKAREVEADGGSDDDA